MAREWKRTKKWGMGAVKNLSILDVQKMSFEERADLAQFMYSEFKKREREAKRSGRTPYALEKLRSEFDKRFNQKVFLANGEVITLGKMIGFDLDTPIARYSRGKWRLSPELENNKYIANTLVGYIAMMKEFFSWKTSTMAGWDKLIDKESMRLFGWHWETQPNGRRKKVANHIMTDEERKAFWSVYDEVRKRSHTMVRDSETMVSSGFVRYWEENMAQNGNFDDIAGLVKKMERALRKSDLEFPEFGNGSQDNPFGPTGGSDIWGRVF